MRDAEIKMMAFAAVAIAVAMYMQAKKGANAQPPGTYYDGYGWMTPGVGYQVTWG